jgi:hypothetical protein
MLGNDPLGKTRTIFAANMCLGRNLRPKIEEIWMNR